MRRFIMKCHRCNGAMVYEKFYSEDGDFFGWRCVVCGEIIDQVILKNRYQQNWNEILYSDYSALMDVVSANFACVEELAFPRPDIPAFHDAMSGRITITRWTTCASFVRNSGLTSFHVDTSCVALFPLLQNWWWAVELSRGLETYRDLSHHTFLISLTFPIQLSTVLLFNRHRWITSTAISGERVEYRGGLLWRIKTSYVRIARKKFP